MSDATGLTKRGTGLTGAAGEYYVAAELSLEGWLATPTIKNAPGTDVLAQNREHGVIVAIQTKTASFGNQFMMNEGIERVSLATNEWVVLVKLLKPKTRPRFFVLPHTHVAAASYAQHARWLNTPGRDGQRHNPNPRRTLMARQFEGYEDRWDLLLQPTNETENLLSDVYAQCIADYGVPAGHPGMPQREQSRQRATHAEEGVGRE